MTQDCARCARTAFRRSGRPTPALRATTTAPAIDRSSSSPSAAATTNTRAPSALRLTALRFLPGSHQVVLRLIIARDLGGGEKELTFANGRTTVSDILVCAVARAPARLARHAPLPRHYRLGGLVLRHDSRAPEAGGDSRERRKRHAVRGRERTVLCVRVNSDRYIRTYL